MKYCFAKFHSQPGVWNFLRGNCQTQDYVPMSFWLRFNNSWLQTFWTRVSQGAVLAEEITWNETDCRQETIHKIFSLGLMSTGKNLRWIKCPDSWMEVDWINASYQMKDLMCCCFYKNLNYQDAISMTSNFILITFANFERFCHTTFKQWKWQQRQTINTVYKLTSIRVVQGLISGYLENRNIYHEALMTLSNYPRNTSNTSSKLNLFDFVEQYFLLCLSACYLWLRNLNARVVLHATDWKRNPSFHLISFDIQLLVLFHARLERSSIVIQR